MIMTDVNLGLKIRATFALEIREKMLVVMIEVDIGPRPATLPPITQVNMLNYCIYLFILAIWIILFTNMKNVILGVMVQDVEVGHNRSATIHFTMMEKLFFVMGEVDLGMRPDTLPPIMQV